MKLSEDKPHFESSAELQQHFFSVQDQGALFEILRSKMYSNPILAICREISSNARDAHREVGTPQKPIHIHLPFGLEPYYKVKDFGPGISPDRMINIFIKYTASTKREDNIQTGGFGLGAKTPFSYSDTFEITTIHNGIRYSYTCLIDDTKVGKLLLLDQRPTDEHNSTEISIPVKKIDFNFYREYTEQACRHWDVKPVITGGHIEWQIPKKIAEGLGWAIISNHDYSHYARLVIDGIEYPLPLDDLRKYADSKLIDASRGNFIMYFGVGELSLSATRENIFLDKSTQNKICDRLDLITKEIKQKVQDKIASYSNLWDANIYYRKELSSVFSNLNFLGKLFWKTHELSNGYLETKCPVFTFTKGKYSKKYGTDPDKLTRSSAGKSLHFVENSALVINDLSIKEPTIRHVKKAFEDDPNLKTLVVICPNDNQSEDDLNKIHHLDEMCPIKLSSLTKGSSRTYTASAQRLLIFKFDLLANAFRQISYDNMEEDINDKVLCLLTRDLYSNRLPLLANKQNLGLSSLKSLLKKFPNISFYGVDRDTDPKRLEEEFNDFIKLDDFIKSKILDNKSINYVEIKFAKSHVYDTEERMFRQFDKFEPLIVNKKSFFITRLKLHKIIREINANDQGVLDIYESVKGEINDTVLKKFIKDNPDWDIQKINKEYENKYPLLRVIQSYDIAHIIGDIADYVNMIDKSK